MKTTIYEQSHKVETVIEVDIPHLPHFNDISTM